MIRAAAAITNQRDIVVLGSQAILAAFPDAPVELLVSVEADVYPRDAPQLADQIDGAIGELSPFHETFGYYAHGVDTTTALLPAGWQERLIPIRNENTGGATGWCLEAHDLACAKLVAGRQKDVRFVRALLTHRMVSEEILIERVSHLPMPSVEMDRHRERIRGLARSLRDRSEQPSDGKSERGT